MSNEITIVTFLIVCPLVGLAGFVDAIGGGGGLISLPAYMLAGVPAHNAIATNKLSSACGTALATGRFIKNGLVNFVLAIPAVISAIIGSYIGAHLSMLIEERVLSIVLLVVLPIVAFVVLNKKIFKDNGSEKVELTYDMIATDTDYSFFVDGEPAKTKWDDKRGFVITFTMPDHDIEVYRTSENTMENEIE